ncbi:hypothetical protein NECAME_11877 [Necator americanus]|uniref:Endonuclease/exonuclease/phosphatase family protein n=1 Tax=Necator americanus TaxID=51031 RepID=W2T2A8_NECAM|nr:hypothetical protein NECAME_11877 [Necator americanus]ETN76140.1 hypothetical protein NECAME_11877 [Necator americanus]
MQDAVIEKSLLIPVGKLCAVALGRTGLQEPSRVPKRKKIRTTICTYNARTLASDAAIEDLMMQARKFRYHVIGLTETTPSTDRRTCDSRGVGGVGVLINTSMAEIIDSFEQLTIRTGRLRMRCGTKPALAMFVAYAPTSSYEEEVEAFYMDLEKFHREGHTFYKVTVADFNAHIGPRRRTVKLHIGTTSNNGKNKGEAFRAYHDDLDHPWEFAIPEALLSMPDVGATRWRVPC